MKRRSSCFLFFIDCVRFHLFAFAVLFSFFPLALLYTPIASPYGMPLENPFPCLQAEQVGVSACDSVRCFGPCLTFLSFLPFPLLCSESHPHLNSSPCLLLPSHPILPNPSSDACGILFRFPAPTDASRRSWGRHAYNCFVHTGRRSCCSVCII